MDFTTPWNDRSRDDRRVVVRHLLEEQGLTSGQAAKRLMTTRNAIIGVASRIPGNSGGIRTSDSRDYIVRQRALARRQRANEADARQRDVATRKNPPKPTAEPTLNQLPPVPDRAWRPLNGSTPKPLHDHREHECRWPIGDPALFCCLPADVGQKYCPAHHALGTRTL